MAGVFFSFHPGIQGNYPVFYTRGCVRTEIWNLLGHLLHSDFYQLLPPCSRVGFSNVITWKNEKIHYKPPLHSKPGISSTKTALSTLHYRPICLRDTHAMICPWGGGPLGASRWNQGHREGEPWL